MTHESEEAAGEGALRHARETLNGILMMSSEGILVAKADGAIRVFSTGAEAMFGYAAHEVIGRHVEMLMPERFRGCHSAHIAEFMQSGITSRKMNRRPEIIGLRKGGEEFPASASLSRQQTAEGTIFTVIMRDLSEEKALVRALSEAKARAEEASLAKSVFVANMGHELRTPLNAILGFSELLTLDTTLSAAQRGYAADINGSGKQLLDIVNDILTMARIDAGRLPVSEDEVSLSEVVGVCVERIELQSRTAGVKVRTETQPDLPLIRADRRLLGQAVANLVSNAVKFTDRGGAVGVAALRTDDGGAEIVVRDTGIGIGAETVRRIGEPFLQVNRSPVRTQNGVGLGLLITKRLVEMQDARLSVEAGAEGGTVARVIFPASLVGARTKPVLVRGHPTA